MRAAIYETAGPRAGQLRSVDFPEPAPLSGEVRVRVVYSGVNPTDVRARSRSGAAYHPYQVPNQDGAGVIDQVGAGVDWNRIGERVWIYHGAHERPMGTAAEYICLPEHLSVPLPDGVDYEQGAALGVPAVTAHRCLSLEGDLDGRTVLVTGGAGAVGNAAVQLALWQGASRVLATVSDQDKARLAEEAGADAALNYREPTFARDLAIAARTGIDVVVDVAVAENISTYIDVLNPHAAISSYTSLGSPLQTEVAPLMRRNATIRFYHVFSTPQADLQQAALDINAALTAGALQPLPYHRFQLEDAAQAHDACEAGVVGKVLIQIAGA